jgi:Amiloride-sensitive sodium channel
LWAHISKETLLLNKTIPYSATSSLDYVAFIVTGFPNESYFDVEAMSGYHLIIHRTDELPSDSSFHFHQFYHHSNAEAFPHQTVISDELKHESIEKRNCYLDDEKDLELFKVYTKQNCEHECQTFAFSVSCGCVPFYLLSKLFYGSKR